MLKFIGSLCVIVGISLLCSVIAINPIVAFSLLVVGFGIAVLVL